MQLALEFRVRLLERARLGSHRPRHPVDRTELVEDRALDTRDGVRLELVAAVEIELLDGIDETEDAVADEIGLLHVLGEPDRDATGDVLHQRGVVQDQRVSNVAPPGRLVRRPEPIGLGCSVCAQLRSLGSRVGRIEDSSQPLSTDVSVYLCRCEVGVAEQLLYCP